MDVKLGQLPSWLGTRDFTPNGFVGSVRRGETLCGMLSLKEEKKKGCSPSVQF